MPNSVAWFIILDTSSTEYVPPVGPIPPPKTPGIIHPLPRKPVILDNSGTLESLRRKDSSSIKCQ